MHLNSSLLFKRYAQDLFRNGVSVLEIGPDAFPSAYQKIVNDPSIKWETLDMQALPSLTYVSLNECTFPIESNSFDIVLSGQVIEHVRRPWAWVRELARVCKAGGIVITISPINWEYHEAPIDCWRIYPDGMRALYLEADLNVEICEQGALDPTHSPCSATSAGGIAGAKSVGPAPAIDLITVGVKACEVDPWLGHQRYQPGDDGTVL